MPFLAAPLAIECGVIQGAASEGKDGNGALDARQSPCAGFGIRQRGWS